MDDQAQTINADLRRLPPVHALMAMAPAQALATDYARPVLLDAVRERLAQVRRDLRHGVSAAPFCRDDFFAQVRADLEAQGRTRLQRVINATGIVLHTNLGRAPLADEAIRAVREVTQGYSNLELNLGSGKRGGRGGQIESLLRRLTGAEAALVVNNGAAAVLLALTTVAQGGDVLISRGELVEIGGGFRIPDVIRQSGARLVEVGTTNKTRLADYENALTEQTKVILKVHASNYRIVGFHSEAPLEALAALGRAQGVPVMEDLGSGALTDLTRFGLPAEPTVAETIRQCADVVAFSGDKLLGGPQCGILVGREEQIARMGRHPLFRALRADKMTLAALEATLRLYEDETRLRESLPVLRMLTQTPAQLAGRARRLRRGLSQLPGLTVRVTDGVGYSGGGTLPESGLPSKHVGMRSQTMTVEQIAEALRRWRPAILGIRADDWYVMDVRTIGDDEIGVLVAAFRALAQSHSESDEA